MCVKNVCVKKILASKMEYIDISHIKGLGE